MAKMNLPHPPDGCQPGERLVFKKLQQLLPDSYFIWFEPTLFGKRKSSRPDFIILGADIGLAIIEVKDWTLDSIRAANRETFELQFGNRIERRTNPAQQVRSYVLDAITQLETSKYNHPELYRTLQQTRGAYRGKLAFPVSGFVAFPHITRREWESCPLELDQMLHTQDILLKDDFSNGLAERLKRAAVFPASLSNKQLQTIKWLMYPETRLPAKQGELFTLDAEQVGLAKLDTYLPIESQTLARKGRVKLLRGVVGSGKTLILLYRAKFISEQNKKWRILILTYNKTLAEHMRRLFVQIGGDTERVEIIHFHKWAIDLLKRNNFRRQILDDRSRRGLIKRVLNTNGTHHFSVDFLADEFQWIKERVAYQSWDDYPNPAKISRRGRGHNLGATEKEKRQAVYRLFQAYQHQLKANSLCDWDDVPVQLLQQIENGTAGVSRYHAILIDEAQDFAPSWFRAAFAMLNPATKMVFIAGDGTQQIYRHDFTWRELGLGITARDSFTLTRSYRSTRQIVDVALEVIRDSQTLLRELTDSGDKLVEPDERYAEFRSGPMPVLLSFESPEKEYAEVAREIVSLLRQGYQPSQIAILRRHRFRNDALTDKLNEADIPFHFLNSGTPQDNEGIQLCTLHSAKGLEFEAVFICGLDEFQVKTPVETSDDEFQQMLDFERKLLYVGMTRARQLLYITYSGAGAEWITQRLQSKLKSPRRFTR